MFATRTDQENRVYNHQAAAAAKPLNQRGETKTPGPQASKTPFRTNKQDENVILFGKTGQKTGGKANQDAFVTPAGPRTRAPLGMKTTNVKATAFQTPAPPSTTKNIIKSTQKPVSPRLRRGRVKIHQAETVPVDIDDGEPDIEYMPPKSVPLPDYPDDIHEIDFDGIFDSDNLARDIAQISIEPLASGMRKAQLDRERKMQLDLEKGERQMKEALARDPYARYGDAELEQLYLELCAADRAKSTTARKGLSHNRTPSTLASKTAALALTDGTPSFAAPTAATKRKAQAPKPLAAKPVNTNHATATIASRSTLGYAKGRAVSASKRTPLSSAHQAPVVKKRTDPISGQDVVKSYAVENPFKGTPMERLLDDKLEETLRRGFEEAPNEAQGNGFGDEEDEALKDFVLDLPVEED